MRSRRARGAMAWKARQPPQPSQKQNAKAGGRPPPPSKANRRQAARGGAQRHRSAPCRAATSQMPRTRASTPRTTAIRSRRSSGEGKTSSGRRACQCRHECQYANIKLQLHRIPKQRMLHTQSDRSQRGMCVHVNRAVSCTRAMASMCADMQTSNGVSERLCVSDTKQQTFHVKSHTCQRGMSDVCA